MELPVDFIVCDVGLVVGELVVVGGDGEVGVDAVRVKDEVV